MEINYKELGLKVGLEIHQQLDTEHKLFCNCRTDLADPDTPRDEVIRYLRATKSEIGEIDPAALYEMRKGRRIIYEVPYGHACLVELDEEPPHELNREALVIAIALAKALNAKILDEIYVMRKTVIDGSNTTGFQRTAIIAVGGYVDDEEGRVGIQTICLEEDAARKVEEGRGYVKYCLDRLGIPLIEISTSPDIHSPEQALRVAHRIGLILRLSGKVKRGLGTIRQDLNVSIKDGVKTEIKGVSKLELIPKVIEYEVVRQLNLLRIRDELKNRGIKEEDIESPVYDITEVLAKSSSRLIQKTLRKGLRAYAIVLKGFAGILGREVQPGRRFGTELADYARAWGGVTGLIHSDELPGYGIDENIVNEVFNYLRARKGIDAFVFVLADRERAERALRAVIDRAKYALVGIPKETRAANPDGTTRYMRPQPGAARMYPETDVPPVRITEDILKEAEKYVPKTPEEVLKELVDVHGLSEELAKELIKDPLLHTYLELYHNLREKVPAKLIASTLMIHLKYLKSEGLNIELVTPEVLKEVLLAVSNNEIAKEAIPEVLKEYIIKYPKLSIKEIINQHKALSKEDLERIVKNIVNMNTTFIKEKGERAFGKIMGLVMKEVRGKIDGRIVAEVVRKYIREILSS